MASILSISLSFKTVFHLPSNLPFPDSFLPIKTYLLLNFYRSFQGNFISVLNKDHLLDWQGFLTDFSTWALLSCRKQVFDQISIM